MATTTLPFTHLYSSPPYPRRAPPPVPEAPSPSPSRIRASRFIEGPILTYPSTPSSTTTSPSAPPELLTILSQMDEHERRRARQHRGSMSSSCNSSDIGSPISPGAAHGERARRDTFGSIEATVEERRLEEEEEEAEERRRTGSLDREVTGKLRKKKSGALGWGRGSLDVVRGFHGAAADGERGAKGRWRGLGSKG